MTIPRLPRTFVAACVAVIVAWSVPALAQSNATVTVDGGALAGRVVDGAVAFEGIPYAAPPVGSLRWRAPQPVRPWAGVRAATTFGHDCMQVAVRDESAPLATTPSEDCLTLNVWRPVDAAPNARLPVMVWFHGGGYVNGGSSTAVYDGAPLARRGVVVVTFNYRLGRLGFFAPPALIAAHEGPVGNFGYMDQIAALKWVQANIAAFAGDRSRVTLAGESAGGASVIAMLASPVTTGLFQQAVVMSGGGRRAFAARPMTGGSPDEPSAEQSDGAFVDSLGIKGTPTQILASLRALPASTIVGDVSLPALLLAVVETGARNYPGTPMIDGTIVTAQPSQIFHERAEAKVPIMIGTVARDLPLVFPPRNDPFTYFGPDAKKAKSIYNPDGSIPTQLVLLDIGSDMTMHEPARFVARSLTAAGSPAWLYRFTYVAQNVPDRQAGAAHAQEVAYMFDTVDIRYDKNITNKDREVARTFSTYVANFVMSGDPNGKGLPTWPRFSAGRFDVMNFTLDDGPVFSRDPRAAQIDMIQTIEDAQTQR